MRKRRRANVNGHRYEVLYDSNRRKSIKTTTPPLAQSNHEAIEEALSGRLPGEEVLMIQRVRLGGAVTIFNGLSKDRA